MKNVRRDSKYHTPEKNYPSLEAMSPAAVKVEGFVGFSHLQGNWYLVLWEAD